MTFRQIKRSLVTREMQVKSLRYHFIPTEIPRLKRQTIVVVRM
jgi:hypothetical protein